jgi:hypothetical protein
MAGSDLGGAEDCKRAITTVLDTARDKYGVTSLDRNTVILAAETLLDIEFQQAFLGLLLKAQIEVVPGPESELVPADLRKVSSVANVG